MFFSQMKGVIERHLRFRRAMKARRDARRSVSRIFLTIRTIHVTPHRPPMELRKDLFCVRFESISSRYRFHTTSIVKYRMAGSP